MSPSPESLLRVSNAVCVYVNKRDRYVSFMKEVWNEHSHIHNRCSFLGNACPLIFALMLSYLLHRYCSSLEYTESTCPLELTTLINTYTTWHPKASACHKTPMKADSEFSKNILCHNGHSSGHSNEGLVIIPGGKELAAALESPNT